MPAIMEKVPTKEGGIASGSSEGEEQSRQSQEPVEGAEETKDLAAAGGKSAVVSDEEVGEVEGGEEAGGGDLIPASRLEALRKAGDFDALYKEMNRAFTQKTQAISATRRSLESYSDFIEALESNPRQAILETAKRLGLSVTDASESGTKEAAKDLSTAVSEAISAELGEDYAELSPRLSKAITRAAEMIVREQQKPLIERQEQIIADAAMRESEAALTSFAQVHSDWKKYEKEMVVLSKKYQPGEGTSELDYLEMLYTMVTKDRTAGDAVRKSQKRISESAREAESSRGGVSGAVVARRPAGLPTFAEAAEAARRGERFE